jgi:lysophospholipase-3
LEGNLHLLVNRLTLRGEQRSSLSNLYMLPSMAAWPRDAVIAKTPYKTYTVADMDDFLRNVGIPRAVQMRRAITNSSSMMKKSPGVPIYCFHGHIAESTMDHVVFGSSGFPDNPYSVVNGGGDGTVNEESLRLCETFAALQKQPVKMTVVEGVNHGGVLGDAGVLTAIDALLKGGNQTHDELKRK